MVAKGESGTERLLDDQVSGLELDGARRRERIWRKAYAAQTQDDLRELYADWAKDYERDHASIGYFGHVRAVEVLSRHCPSSGDPRILDAGAGTGLAGQQLHDRGYRRLIAIDLSADMLEQARAKGVYAELEVADLAWPVDTFTADTFDAVVLVGVFSFGQAPAHALDEVLRLVRPGGHVVFTMRCDFHDQDAMGVASKMRELEASGAWRLVECTEPEPYLPEKDPDATFRVWCFEALAGKRFEPTPDFLTDVGAALADPGTVKVIAHHHIWDAAASRLYDAYIQRPEYYLNDSEEEVLRENAGDFLGDHALCVELGCGSAEKIKNVFEAVLGDDDETIDYIPIDVSPGALETTERQIREAFGDRVHVEPKLGTFDETLASIPSDRAKALFFLGGSIGNFETIDETIAFLAMVQERMTTQDRFVVGFDLTKDAHVFERAYNAGPENRAFFVHMVRRINDLLGATFDVGAFELGSVYEPEEERDGVLTGCVSLRVVTTRAQEVHVPRLRRTVKLEAGDAIQVGRSRKFTPDAVGELATLAALRLRSLWFDSRHYFALAELVRADATPA